MLLRPDRVMTQIIVYLLAVAAERFHMKIHALCAMSTHIHLVVTDMEGELPAFLQFFHLMVARCTMVHRRWNASVWDSSPTSVVRLGSRVAMVEKIAYVLANPVTAGLVRRAHEWPGAKVLASEIGCGVLRARRPQVYLNPKNSDWQDEAMLAISFPPGVDASEEASFQRQVTAEVARLEACAQAHMAERRRSVLGPARARVVPPTARATSDEPTIDRNPTFAVGRDQGNAWHDAVAALRAFRTAYRDAFKRWCAGVRSVVFPAGTWLMHELHGAAVAAAMPGAASTS
jgi:REP element-mobilizing transposase RayT